MPPAEKSDFPSADQSGNKGPATCSRSPRGTEERLAPVPPEGHQMRDPYKGVGGYVPMTSDPLSRWRSYANRDNDRARV